MTRHHVQVDIEDSRCRGDGGAVVVEFALAVPILVLFLAAIFDYGLGWRQENQIQIALLNATRTNAQLSKNRFADFEALRAISASTIGLKQITMTKVIVWDATLPANNTVPTSCKNVAVSQFSVGTFGVSQLCNVYSPAQISNAYPVGFPAGSSASPSCPAGSWDANWCPVTDRSNSDGFGDYLGMYVEVVYNAFTGFVPNKKITISESAVYRLEPPYVGG